MERITKKQLKGAVERLNRATGNPVESYIKDSDGRYRAQVGNYHLDWAYGGVSLCKMFNESGGVTTIWGRGTKRECIDAIWCVLNCLYQEKLEAVEGDKQ